MLFVLGTSHFITPGLYSINRQYSKALNSAPGPATSETWLKSELLHMTCVLSITTFVRKSRDRASSDKQRSIPAPDMTKHYLERRLIRMLQPNGRLTNP